MCFRSIKCATDVRPPLKNANTNNKYKNMNKWNKIKKEGWLACMLVGISLLTWAISQGECFTGHIPLACFLLIFGVAAETSNTKGE